MTLVSILLLLIPFLALSNVRVKRSRVHASPYTKWHLRTTSALALLLINEGHRTLTEHLLCADCC